MSLPDLDILEVKSVSDMISVFETPAADTASPADLAHRAACAARRSRVQMEDAATHLVRH